MSPENFVVFLVLVRLGPRMSVDSNVSRELCCVLGVS